ncbi:UNVERIFIED_CONTAM: hypothetical protein K2H54_048237 [Gekko kuhli]
MVAVTDDEDGNSAFVEGSPTLLRRGACFGEVALIKDAKRIATVVCMEDTELLVVDKKDFFGYQLDQELHREFLTRYNYLRKVDIFETLSNDSVEKIAHFCRIERFHFGQVITSDIGESSSITFVIKVDLSNCPSYHKWLAKQLHFPKSKQVKERKQEVKDYVSDIVYVDRFKSTRWSSFSGHELSQLRARYACQPLNRDVGKQSSVFSKPCKSVVIKVDTADSSHTRSKHGQAGNNVALLLEFPAIPKEVNLQDNRPMILVSKGADLILLKKDKLEECADNATIMKLGKIKVKYPSDDELCQVFLRQNSWDFFKKDVLQFVLRPRLMRMVSPAEACPAEEIAGSWYMNEKGILDLTPLQCHQKLPPETCRYVPCHPKCAKDADLLPEIQPRLIHGINIIRPPLDGVF